MNKKKKFSMRVDKHDEKELKALAKTMRMTVAGVIRFLVHREHQKVTGA